jgi:uncharacterized glyoxalase superfamily protein PhnB
MAVRPIPKGFHSVTPYLVVPGVARVIEFLQKGFNADLLERHDGPDGRVMHAQVRIGDSPVMLGEPHPPWTPMPASLYLYVQDTDATYRQAMAAGGLSVMEPMTHFYGDRNAGVKDPSGNVWWIATHVEDVAPEELARRAEEYAKKQKG